MALVLKLIASLGIGYVLGAIPVGLFVVWWMTGRDVRTVGSGRTGGTNAMRAAGRRAFFLTGFGDGAKGLAAILLVRWFFPDVLLATTLAGIGVIVGHNWSAFIGFKGGAGGAANIGVLLGLHPLTAVLAVLAGAIAFVTSRMASVATLTGSATALLLLVAFAALGQVPWAYVVYGAAQFILVVLALRPNIRRILEGTERRVNFGHSGPQP